ncbi:MAG: GNAT family N-acetyltransferase [Spirochaetales bacterium]|nr:GNAT family N-acetyltransferase [Spirochaetales bacterium]
MNLSIKALSPDTAEDFFTFFDHIAFSDNPDWAGCYCMYYHNNGSIEDFANSTAEKNRKAAAALIESGGMQGFLAYLDDGPAGWCNVNKKTAYPFLLKDPQILSPEDHRCRAVTCFTIAPGYRRRGIARRLLEHIIEDHRLHHQGILEAYPRKQAEGDAQHYHGPLELYLSSGFKAVKSLDQYTIVRYPGD